MELDENTFLTNTCPYMGYHIAPTKGLINDPQGLVQCNGMYHVFYQWNPKGTTHENKSWAHIVSNDLVKWKILPPALLPDQAYDKDGCYTGCALVHQEAIYLFYTGNVRDENNNRVTYQCLAKSEDGIHFEKLGPIIEVPENYTGHIRDPKVWQEEENLFYMLLGAQTSACQGTTLLYKSNTVLEWELVGTFLDKDLDLGYMWECPNLVRFPEADVFVFSPQGIKAEGMQYHNIYQSGYVTGRFHNQKLEATQSTFKELDRGFEFYAPQFFVDEQGRNLMFGWMGVMSEEKERQLPTIKQGWAHTLTLPREITYQNNKIYQAPIEELQTLRGNKSICFGSTKLVLEQYETEIVITSINASLEVKYRDEVQIKYCKDTKIITVSRTDWVTKKREYRNCQLENECTKMQMYIENTSLELFINNGEEVFSMRYFTNNQNLFALQTNSKNIKTEIYSLLVDCPIAWKNNVL